MRDNVRTNVLVNLVRTITMMILSFVTFPYVCRILGDEMMGLYSWAAAFVYYFFVLARISIPNIAVREIMKVRDDKEKLSQKTYEFLILQSITTLISFGLMCAIVFSFGVNDFASETGRALIFILSLNFLTGVLSFEWLYTALEKHAYMAYRSVLIAAIVDILIFMFVRYKEHVLLYSFLTIGTTLLTVASNLVYLPFVMKFKRPKKLNLKQYFPLLGILLLISVSAALYDKTDTFILGFMSNSKSEVGSYAVGMKGVELVIGIILALSTVFMPRATYYFQNKQQKQFENLNKYSVNVCLIIVIPAVALMIALATPITKLIAGENGYLNADIMLIALASLMITFSLSNIIYTQILIPSKREKLYLVCLAGAVLLNIGLSLLFGLLLFKDKPGFGVALGTAITDVLLLTVLVCLTWGNSKKAIFNVNTLKMAILGLIIGVVATIVSPFLIEALSKQMDMQKVYILDALIIGVSSLIIYFVGLILIKEKLIRSLIHR